MIVKILENMKKFKCWHCVQCPELMETGWKGISGHDPMWYCPSCLYPYYRDQMSFTFPTANSNVEEKVMKDVISDMWPSKFSRENIKEQFYKKRYDFLLKYRGCIGYMPRYVTVGGIVIKGDDEVEEMDHTADITNN